MVLVDFNKNTKNGPNLSKESSVISTTLKKKCTIYMFLKTQQRGENLALSDIPHMRLWLTLVQNELQS